MKAHISSQFLTETVIKKMQGFLLIPRKPERIIEKIDTIASNKSSEISARNLNSILTNYGINLLSKILKKFA